MAERTNSLRNRLLRHMVLPVALLALLFGTGGAVLIHEVINLTHDRLLDAALITIATENDQQQQGSGANVPLFLAALAALQNTDNDQAQFCIADGATLISGDGLLCSSAHEPVAPGGIEHFYIDLADTKYRVAETNHPSGANGHKVRVRVAETLNERLNMEARMLVLLVLLEAMLISSAGILSYIAVLRGLLPLTDIGRELLDRSTTGAIVLKKIDANKVPEEARDIIIALNTMMERLDETIASVRNFTADASHQLRSPVAVIRLHLEILERQASGQLNLNTTISEARNGVLRLERILNQLMVLAHADMGQEALLVDELVDLNRTVLDTMAELVPKALEKGIELELDELGEPVSVQGKSTLIAEIVKNIIDNSIIYTQVGGRVSVKIGATETVAFVEIEDNGPGISETERTKVFQRFYRITRSHAPSGSGLGLSIARRLLEIQGGAISLETPPTGEGLLVKMSFRLFRAAA